MKTLKSYFHKLLFLYQNLNDIKSKSFEKFSIRDMAMIIGLLRYYNNLAVQIFFTILNFDYSEIQTKQDNKYSL